MRLNHRLINKDYNLFNKNSGLMPSDICFYCGASVLFLTKGMPVFNNYMYIDSQYRIEAEDYMNEKYPCITEEEYIIKKLLK